MSDLSKVLVREKERSLKKSFNAIEKAKEILNAQSKLDKDIISIFGYDSQITDVQMKVDRLEAETKQLQKNSRTFSLEEIETVCIRYRFRFLQARLYKGHMDHSVLTAIKAFAKENGIEDVTKNPGRFYVAAPVKSFNLLPKPKDPLLFYKNSDNNYELICKWGKDINWFRKLLVFPLRSEIHFNWTIILFFVLSYFIMAGILGLCSVPEYWGYASFSLIPSLLFWLFAWGIATNWSASYISSVVSDGCWTNDHV